MGGNIAGVYAARHPSDLCGVTLICPAGERCVRQEMFPNDRKTKINFICGSLIWQMWFFSGLQYPTESKFVQRLRELEKTQDADGIPLIPSTPEEMEQMLKLCSYVRFKIPKQVHKRFIFWWKSQFLNQT